MCDAAGNILYKLCLAESRRDDKHCHHHNAVGISKIAQRRIGINTSCHHKQEHRDDCRSRETEIPPDITDNR